MSVAAKKPVTYAERVGQLIRMLGSDREGERHAALGALDRTLRNAGLDFNVLASAVEPLNDQLDFVAEMDRVYEVGLAANARKEPPPNLDFNTFRDVDGKVTWQAMALFCQERRDRLKDDWEREFIADMAAGNRGRDPSERQMPYLKKAYFRLGGKP
jgi:hypothetical protein